MDEQSTEWGRDRDAAVREADLSPESLVGSYFRHEHDEDDGYDEGVIVAQVWVGPFAPLVAYLVEFYDHSRNYQRVMGLDRMMADGWLFYDHDAWLASRARRAEGVPAPVQDDTAEEA